MENKIKIYMIIMFVMMATTVSVGAVTLINSKDVIYDNTVSGLESTTVQGAVDELYSAASDYSALNSKISKIENDITTLENKAKWNLIASPNMSLAFGENYIGTYDLSNYNEVFVKFGYVQYAEEGLIMPLIPSVTSGTTSALLQPGKEIGGSVNITSSCSRTKVTEIKAFVNILYDKGIIVSQIYAR